jgi:hypothetical protein
LTDKEERLLAETIRDAYDQIEVHVVDLPATLQGRVDEALAFMSDADKLSPGMYGFHYHGDRSIAQNTARDMHALLTAFLRNEPALPDPSEWMIEYRAAYEDLLEERENEFAPDIAESEHERREWLENHPAVRDELDGRRSTKGPRA